MANKRDDTRKTLIYSCWVDGGPGQLAVECRLQNISQTGAKLIIEGLVQISDVFILYLTRDGNVGRKCKVAWRRENEIGFEFLSRNVPKARWSEPIKEAAIVVACPIEVPVAG